MSFIYIISFYRQNLLMLPLEFRKNVLYNILNTRIYLNQVVLNDLVLEKTDVAAQHNMERWGT